MPPVYAQGEIGSCTANAIAGAIQFDRLKNKQGPDFLPARLFIYYNERAMAGSIGTDSGAQIRDGIKSVAKQGVCPESLWPYVASPADPNTGEWPAGAKAVVKPSPAAYTAAAQFEAVKYMTVNQSEIALKQCLADGWPVVFGITVYNSLWDDNGEPRVLVPMPGPNDHVEGGHAICIVGYDDSKKLFTIRNSWGPDHQEAGHFFLPYEYVLSKGLASDFWTIRVMKH